MNYEKPQVTTLGDAKTLISLTGFKPLVLIGDGIALLRHLIPAYDLDE
jgi:hypothetical protein